MFKRRRDAEPLTKIEKRASSLPNGDLMGWAENALYTTERNLFAYQRDKNTFYLNEAKMGAESLMAIIKVLERRNQADER